MTDQRTGAILESVRAKSGQFAFTREERAELLQQARAYQKKIDRLRRIVPSKPSLAKREAQQMLTSVRAKICAIVRTTPLAEASSINLTEVYARAAALTPSSASDEAVSVRVKPKGGSGWRPITKFGPARRAYQQVCEDVLRATLPSFAFDFGDGDGGVERMILFILRGLESGDYDHVVTADVRDCYGSIIRKENLERSLCIPHWAYEKVLTVDCQTRLEMPHTWPTKLTLDVGGAVRRGLPQGASPSSLLMSRAILGPVLAGTSFANRMVLYGDNIAVLARGRQDGDAIYSALRSALESSPDGPLTIGENAIQSARGKITLVQYALQPVAPRHGDGWRIVPSWKSYRNFESKVLMRAAKGHSLDRVQAYKNEWIASMRLWQPHATALDYLTMTMTTHWQMGRGARMSSPHRQG